MSKTNLINLTPHEVVLVCGDHILAFPSSGTVARVIRARRREGTLKDGDVLIPINAISETDIANLPPPESGTQYIVSNIVARFASDRDDLLAVDQVIRNNNGRIIGAAALAKIRN